MSSRGSAGAELMYRVRLSFWSAWWSEWAFEAIRGLRCLASDVVELTARRVSVPLSEVLRGACQQGIDGRLPLRLIRMPGQCRDGRYDG